MVLPATDSPFSSLNLRSFDSGDGAIRIRADSLLLTMACDGVTSLRFGDDRFPGNGFIVFWTVHILECRHLSRRRRLRRNRLPQTAVEYHANLLIPRPDVGCSSTQDRVLQLASLLATRVPSAFRNCIQTHHPGSGCRTCSQCRLLSPLGS